MIEKKYDGDPDAAQRAMDDAMHYASYVAIIGPDPDNPIAVQNTSRLLNDRLCLMKVAQALRLTADSLDEIHAERGCPL